ncbi:hypothetical protein Tco_0452541 [Tanacetum coccineum]
MDWQRSKWCASARENRKQANKPAGPKEANPSIGTQDNIDVENSKMETKSAQDYFVLPIWFSYTSTVKSTEAKNKDTKDLLLPARASRASSTNTVNTASTPVSTASPSGRLSYIGLTNSDQYDTQIAVFEDSYDNPNDGRITAIQNSEVWILVDLPHRKKAIRTKWVYRKNRRMKRLLWFEIKARWMCRVLLYAQLMREGYDSQPPGFVDPKCPQKSGYRRGTIDKTLFIKKDKNEFMLIKMSSMGELTFFLRLQVKQKENDIFTSQDKYVAEILKKYDFASVKTASTPIEDQEGLALVKDEKYLMWRYQNRISMIGGDCDEYHNWTSSGGGLWEIEALSGRPRRFMVVNDE